MSDRLHDLIQRLAIDPLDTSLIQELFCIYKRMDLISENLLDLINKADIGVKFLSTQYTKEVKYILLPPHHILFYKPILTSSGKSVNLLKIIHSDSIKRSLSGREKTMIVLNENNIDIDSDINHLDKIFSLYVENIKIDKNPHFTSFCQLPIESRNIRITKCPNLDHSTLARFGGNYLNNIKITDVTTETLHALHDYLIRSYADIVRTQTLFIYLEMKDKHQDISIIRNIMMLPFPPNLFLDYKTVRIASEKTANLLRVYKQSFRLFGCSL